MAEKDKKPPIPRGHHAHCYMSECLKCPRMGHHIKEICKKECKCKDGKSAYEIAVENGFVGTEQEWLESLKGEQGEQGIQGEKGDRGEKGESGGFIPKFFQMQSQNNKGGSVDPGANKRYIPFDTIIWDGSNGDVVYNESSHTFTLKGGTYLINYEVYYDTTTSTRAKIGIVYENSYRVYSYGTPNTGIVCGSVIVPAFQDLGSMSVFSDTTLKLIDFDTQANISIVKLA